LNDARRLRYWLTGGRPIPDGVLADCAALLRSKINTKQEGKMDIVKVKAEGTLKEILAHAVRIASVKSFLMFLGERTTYWRADAEYEIRGQEYRARINVKIAPQNICRAREQIARYAAFPERSVAVQGSNGLGVDYTRYSDTLIHIHYLDENES
jgi:hypothetical protein